MKFRTIVASLVVLFLQEVCPAQTLDWNTTGAGARAEGFGGAFIGVADDATAIVWNPAGLTQLERVEVSAVGRYVSESFDFSSKLPGNAYTQSNTQSHFNFNFGSIAVPFSFGGTNVVVAAAYQTQLDFYGKQNSDTTSYESTGAGSTVTPGFAVRIGPVLSVGAAANIWLGSWDESLQFNQTLHPFYRDASLKFEASFSGLNFVAGGLVDLGGLPNPIPLKFGVTVRTPFTLKRDDKFSETIPSVPFNSKVNQTTEIDMPLMVGVGASYRFGDNLTLAADFETRLFKDRKLRVLDSTGTLSSSDSLTQSNEDLNQFRVGGEYLFVFPGGVIPLRAGFRTVPTVLANFAWDRDKLVYNPTDQVSGIGYSVGTGFISNNFALDATFSHDQYDQKWTDAGSTDFEAKNSIDKVSVSVIVYF